MAKKFNPTYQINLLDVFRRAYGSESVELRNALRPTLSSDGFKRLYGRAVEAEIYDRTTSGIDKNGKSMGVYKSEAYKGSLEFKIYKGNKKQVDLKLTGYMLSDIRQRDQKYTIIFSFRDQLNRDKAQGHITGKYGKKGRTKPRDFFGLPKDVEEQIMKDLLKASRRTDLGVIAEQFDNITQGVVGTITVEDLDVSED